MSGVQFSLDPFLISLIPRPNLVYLLLLDSPVVDMTQKHMVCSSFNFYALSWLCSFYLHYPILLYVSGGRVSRNERLEFGYWKALSCIQKCIWGWRLKSKFYSALTLNKKLEGEQRIKYTYTHIVQINMSLFWRWKTLSECKI